MKLSYENENRVLIAIFFGIFLSLTHVLFGLGDFVPPPGYNVFAVSIAWALSGIGLIWISTFSRRISHAKKDE